MNSSALYTVVQDGRMILDPSRKNGQQLALMYVVILFLILHDIFCINTSHIRACNTDIRMELTIKRKTEH